MSRVNIEFPYEITDVDPAVNEELLQYFHQGERTGYVQVGPEKYFFPYKYKAEAAKYYNFEARASDIWIATFPRSGTTWTQELIWLIANNLDFETAKNRLLGERFPFFEFPIFVHPEVKAELLKENSKDEEKLKFIEVLTQPGYEALSAIPTTERRFIKTHFPFSLLPPSVMQKQCKVIYVQRNVKDVAISFFYLNRLFRTQGYTGNFERYWQYFERGLNPWMPYYSHLREAYANRHHPNILFLRYEEMLADLSGTILKIAKFLDYKLSAEGLENLINHLNIKNFRINPSVNGHELAEIGILNKGEAGFVRKGGESAGKQQEFNENPELLKRAEAWIAEQELELKDFM